MRRLLLCLAIAGCARAGKENSIIGGLIDARPRSDGSLIDAPQATTLTQTTSETISLGDSFACPNSMTGFTHTNSYYRVFRLSEYNIATTLHVVQVDFGIDTATAGSGGQQPATVHIGTYGGTPDAATLDLSMVRSISSADIQIPDGSGTRMTVPITADVAASASMIVELALPDGFTPGNRFLIAVNPNGESKPGYTLGPDCQITVPTTMNSVASSISKGESDIVLTVTGTTDSVPN